MTISWYPAIHECCAYWSDAPMLQQTFEALERNFNDGNDACIDCAKSIVEVVCRVIIEELDDPASPLKPAEESPDFGKWVSAAVRILKLGDVRHTSFQKLISQHHKLTTTLGTLRNDAGPVSHGKDGFIERLSTYHQRAAVLSADAIVAFLHQAYLEAEPNLARTREPYERFREQNALIDSWCVFTEQEIDDEGLLAVTIQLPNDAESLNIETTPSQFLFYLDRAGYIEALNTARSAEISAIPIEENIE
ncbi:MAG: abortive infection family protein [Candidatus Binatia bacterium]